MKKFVFVLPFIAISLLANCNNGGGDKPGPEPEVSILPTECFEYQNLNGEICLVATEQYQYNDKGLLTKSVNQYTQADYSEVHTYEYDDKNNVTKDTYVSVLEGVTQQTSETIFTYKYDQKDRIIKKTTSKSDVEEREIEEYTYDSDSMDWSNYKYRGNGQDLHKNITRTFKDGLYVKAVDSIKGFYYYYIWDDYKCNTKIEIYNAEEKIPVNHYSDETYAYHKNTPSKITQYVLSYYEGGELESSETTSTEYDKYDRKIKVSNYDEKVLNAYFEYKYAD